MRSRGRGRGRNGNGLDPVDVAVRRFQERQSRLATPAPDATLNAHADPDLARLVNVDRTQPATVLVQPRAGDAGAPLEMQGDWYHVRIIVRQREQPQERTAPLIDPEAWKKEPVALAKILAVGEGVYSPVRDRVIPNRGREREYWLVQMQQSVVYDASAPWYRILRDHALLGRLPAAQVNTALKGL